MALTKQQRLDAWWGGNGDTYVNEVLVDQACDYATETLKLDPESEEFQEAVELYTNGFYGEMKPKEKVK